MQEEKFYAIRLLWVRDPEGFAEYQEQAKPVLAKHGVHIERWLVTEDIEGDGMEKPDQILSFAVTRKPACVSAAASLSTLSFTPGNLCEP